MLGGLLETGYRATGADIMTSRRFLKEKPDVEEREVSEIFEAYGLTPEESKTVVQALSRRPETWVDFMMRFELGLEKPDPRRELISAATIGGSYALGGIVPLAPYVFIGDAHEALLVSGTLARAGASRTRSTASITAARRAMAGADAVMTSIVRAGRRRGRPEQGHRNHPDNNCRHQ